MTSSRFLAAKTPGGLLSTIVGMLTANELLIVQAIENGTYFVFNETPTGTINGTNSTFTLANSPNPSSKAEVFVNGIKQTITTDYSISGATITFTGGAIPQPGSVIKVNYILSPV